MFSLSCLGVQVVLDYKFCLFLTIAIWGAFFASSDFLVLVLVRTRWLSRQFENGVTSVQLSMTYVTALRSLIVLGGPLNSCGGDGKTEWPRRTDESRTLKNNTKLTAPLVKIHSTKHLTMQMTKWNNTDHCLSITNCIPSKCMLHQLVQALQG